MGLRRRSELRITLICVYVRIWADVSFLSDLARFAIIFSDLGSDLADWGTSPICASGNPCQVENLAGRAPVRDQVQILACRPQKPNTGGNPVLRGTAQCLIIYISRRRKESKWTLNKSRRGQF
jgi:hypothetical protein